ncbi:MAPEG family protein [Dyella flagellata]|uniref:Membrane protein n=1 Tax=Dyella flagellata TaxID=1867833 RepID=A0ABQ5X9E1_9GAMM|nr:MAPEG family protein [Dyella flagellata]GLQ87208.1 membrane protein [Dyella flagellata]
MTSLPITSFFTALFTVALVVLSIPVTLRRAKFRVWVGEGTDETLRRRIRAQGNFVEYVPLALIALGLAEARAATTWMVLMMGSILALGRLLHAIGMWRDKAALRGFGMILTYLTLISAAINLLVG